VLPLLIAVAGKPIPAVQSAHGPFSQHVRETVGRAWAGPWLTLDLRRESLPPADRVAAVIVTGSHDSVTALASWMELTATWLREAVVVGKPVLGLCFGHQLLGHALGGEVRRLASGPESGTTRLDLLGTDELIGPALGDPQNVNMMHEDSVVHLPPGAVVLARTALEPHAAVRFGPRAWGLQFHPEFDGSIVRSYLVAMRDQLRLTEAALEQRLAQVADTPWSAGLLRRFAALASTSI
jgi:GMP synthase (glutamine-hydrolysing)